MSRRMGACGFQEFESARDIRIEIIARSLDRVAHAGLRRQVNHDIGTVLGKDLGQQAGSLDPVLDLEICLMASENSRPVALQAGIVIVAETVDADDAPAVCQPALSDVHSDETRRPCDQQGFHSVSPAIWRR